MVIALLGLDARYVEVVEGELVGNRTEVATDGIILIANVLDASAQGCREREVAEILVDVEHGIGVDLLRRGIVLAIVAILLGEDAVGRSGILALETSRGIVGLGATAYAYALGYVVAQALRT